MNDKDIFLAGGFSIGWNDTPTTDTKMLNNIQHRTRQTKDVETLQKELEQIKEYIQDIQQRQWNLAKLIKYRENDFLMQ